MNTRLVALTLVVMATSFSVGAVAVKGSGRDMASKEDKTEAQIKETASAEAKTDVTNACKKAAADAQAKLVFCSTTTSGGSTPTSGGGGTEPVAQSVASCVPKGTTVQYNLAKCVQTGPSSIVFNIADTKALAALKGQGYTVSATSSFYAGNASFACDCILTNVKPTTSSGGGGTPITN